MTPLISVHAPKAGGSSILRMLQQAYGDSFRTDYSDNPADPLSQRCLDPDAYFNRREKLEAGVACVHGHFHPGKLDIEDGTVLSTMLRDPVDNIISIYWFWRGLSKGHDPMHDYFVDRDLSITAMAKMPLLRRLLSQTYFGGFDMDRFDLIGRHDNREAALSRLSELIGIPLDATTQENVTPAGDERRGMAGDMVLRRELEDILSADVRFFERHAL